MVVHTCERCKIDFTKKSVFIYHINRKNPCKEVNVENNLACKYCKKIYSNFSNLKTHIEKYCKEKGKEINKIEDLEKKIKELEKENNKIKEKDIKKLEIKNENLSNNIENSINILEDNNKLPNLFITLNKYIIEYIYLIREREFVRLNEETYKIGLSKKYDITKRFYKYGKGIEIVCFFAVNDSFKYEKLIMNEFLKNFEQRKEYGTEYFTGDKNKMKLLIANITCLT
jgi:acyl carrier protein phosphodiesterase